MEPPVFKTFESAEGLKQWFLLALALPKTIVYGQVVNPSQQAKQAANNILKADCKTFKQIYRQSALKYFPKTLSETKNEEFQANAVIINRAYEIRQNGSCKKTLLAGPAASWQQIGTGPWPPWLARASMRGRPGQVRADWRRHEVPWLEPS